MGISRDLLLVRNGAKDLYSPFEKMSEDQVKGVEEKLSKVDLTDTSENKRLRHPSPGSDASADSFHSVDAEETDPDDSPQHVVGNDRLCEGLNFNGQVIEPDGQEGHVTDSTPSDEANFIRGVKPEDIGNSPDEDDEEEEFLNEEYLKDLELSMSEEEKNEKRNESLKHKETGNSHFKAGVFTEAVTAYTAGLRICPISFPKDRAILFANRAAAKAKIDLKKEAIKDCSKAIDLDETYLKAILRRATLNEETEQLDDALQDFKRVLELDSYNQEALQAVRRLPDMINERNEKLKEEMMGKLKDLGNMILRPFGLSTNNFELKQDPSSGGYNISFKQNSGT
ncbi:tetratricopeptide repeat protein 1-like isoform X2 [Macrobrachium nipponense]|uniref:tetratricopeptide repeat protein 1-like isoform X2 n=1 Tax=Macrobrachium nipponense TaxID=159736 RepID=UPI0030C7D48A